MSNLLNSAYCNLSDLVQINADDIQTESINTKTLYINNILFDPTGIDTSDLATLSTNQNISGVKTFSGTQVFSSIQLNSDLIVNSGGTTITNSNLALINFLSGTSSNINTRFTTNETNISALQTKTTNMSFASNTTTFTGTMVFPIASISFNAIVGTACTLGQNQTITGTKTFSAVQNFTSNLRLDGSLLVGTAGNVILTNATLQKIAYLANVTSDINATFNNYVLTTTLNTTLNNYVLSSALTTTLNSYVLTTALTTTLNNYVLTTALNTTLNNYVLSTALTTLLNDYVLTTALNTALNNYVSTTALNTALNPINTDISTLNTKTQYISSTSLNTTILNTTNVADLLISTTINGFSKGDFNNVITQCSSLSSNCQNQINDAISKANSAQNKADTAKTNADNAQGTANTALALAGTANAAAIAAAGIATGAASVASGAASGVTALETQVEGIETDVTALQLKTTQISYSLATDRTTISQTLNSPFLEIGNLTSGFTQTSTDQITLAGLLRCNNRVEINNTLELINNNNIIVEGIINQDNATPPNNGVNQFLAPTNISGNLTCSGTNTNINSTNCNITGNAIIKNTSTTSSGTIPPYLSVLSTIDNANAKKLQGILIGRESNSQESNCNIGYNWVTNANLNNYGYLGLNVNTANLKESFRWFDGGCSVPVGNLTISEGNLTITAGNISLPAGNVVLTNGDITLTNGEINLTSGDLNIVSGDATLTSGDLSLGTGDISVNNGDLNIFNGELKTNTISKYSGTTLDINSNGVGSILNLNGPTINIGYNQGLAAVNVINIGSTTSFSTINLNGLVVSAFGFNIGQVSQW